MSRWWETLALWLVDYYLLATLLLVLAFAVLALVRQPARRLAVAWAALLNLLVLASLVALPGWPRLSLSMPEQPDSLSTGPVFILAAADPPSSPAQAGAASSRASADRKVNKSSTVNAEEEMRLLLVRQGREAASGKTRSPLSGEETAARKRQADSGKPSKAAAVPAREPRPLELLEQALPVYLAGSVLALVWIALGAAQIRKVCRGGHDAPAELQGLLQRVRGTRQRPPRLLLHRSIGQPVALGTFWPTILLPARAAEDMPAQQLEAVLAHEWAHIRRGDLWLLALARWLLPLLYLHPLYWWLRGWIREDQETLADAAAAAHSSPIEYAATLVRWVRLGRKRRAAPVLGMGGKPSELKRRIVMLLHPQYRVEIRCPDRWRWSAWSLVGLGALALSLLTVRPVAQAAAEEPQAKPVAQTKKNQIMEGQNRKPLTLEGVVDLTALPVRQIAELDLNGLPVQQNAVLETRGLGQPAAPIPSGKPVELKIASRVLNPQKKPVAGAEVVLVACPPRAAGQPQVLTQIKTDERGQFRAQVKSPADYQVVALVGAKGYGLAWRYFPAGSEQEIVLEPEQMLRGRLIDLQGQPAAGVKVQICRLGNLQAGNQIHRLVLVNDLVTPIDNSGLMIRKNGKQAPDKVPEYPALRFREPPDKLPLWPQAVTTDAQGRFTLNGMSSRQPIGLQIHDSRYALQALEIKPRNKEKPSEATMVVAQARTLEGVVVDADTGQPIPGARLHIPSSRHWQSGQFGLVLDNSLSMGVADWKGRRTNNGHFGTVMFWDIDGSASDELPWAEVQTDKEGRFKIPLFLANSYNLSVTPPQGEPYFPVNRAINWPRAAARQKVKIALVRGVWVRGKVQDKSSGKPVANARVDFWSPGLKVPEGIRIANSLSTGADGKYQALLLPGSWHVLVNAAISEYVVQKISARKVTGQSHLPVPQPTTAEAEKKEQFYFPDGWAALELKPSAPAQEIHIGLKRVVLKGKLVGPDGKPAAQAALFYRHPRPASQVACNACHGDGLAQGRFIYINGKSVAPPSASVNQADVRAGQFELPLRDLEAKYQLLFLDAPHELAAVAEVTGRQGLAQPPTVRLAPCGSARARFLDGQGKPLAKFEPTLWLQLAPRHTIGEQAATTNPAQPLTLSADSPVSAEATVRHVRLWSMEASGDSSGIALSQIDPLHYGKGVATDAKGNVNFPALIPGVTYRLILPDGKTKDFMVEAGKALDLGDFTVKTPKPRPENPKPRRLSIKAATPH